jgi:hypothetical protein
MVRYRPRVPRLLTVNDPRHGTENGYTNLLCRCQPCRDQHALIVKDQRARRHLRLSTGENVNHGEASTYWNWGCRCLLCTKAASVARRRWRVTRQAREAVL